MGDFNNLLKNQDKIGGNLVTKNKYTDLSRMLENTWLYEMDNTEDY